MSETFVVGSVIPIGAKVRDLSPGEVERIRDLLTTSRPGAIRFLEPADAGSMVTQLPGDVMTVRTSDPQAAASLGVACELWNERLRQISDENRTPHGDVGRSRELAAGASAYAYAASVPDHARGWVEANAKADKLLGFSQVLEVLRFIWPWSMTWWKPKDRRRDLVRAGALIIAAIEAGDAEEAQKAGWPHDRQETGV